MGPAAILVSRWGYIDVSEKRYSLHAGVVAGRDEGGVRGASAVRLLIA